jgi:hypothetical protein
MKTCRIRASPAWMIAGLGVHALLEVAADVGHQQNAIHRRDAEQRDEADRRGNAEVEARDIEPEDAAGDRERNAGQRDQAVAHRIEQRVEQRQDQEQAERHDDRKPALGILQRAELARPLHAVALRQRHVLGNRSCASATVEPRSRSRTLYFSGMKRWLFSR